MCPFLVVGVVPVWLAGCEGLPAGDRGGDLGGPGPSAGDLEAEATSAADKAPGWAEEAEAEPFGFPAAGGAREGEHLRPREQFAGQGDDLGPDLVLAETVQGKVPQAGVLGAPDAVLAPGAAAVQQFQVGELAALGAGRENR